MEEPSARCEAEGPNAAQIEYWNEIAGPKWVAAVERLDAQISSFGLAAMQRLAPQAGERGIDCGCGCGQTTLQLARRVGSDGRVLGIDIARVMLTRAAARLRQCGVSHVRFENADAQIHGFQPGSFDFAFSRFGVMFFENSIHAFANLRRALVAGGRLVFVCWQAVDRNPWMTVPLAAAARHLELPEPPEPGQPGPFSLAAVDRLGPLLERAGFDQVQMDPFEQSVVIAGGGTLEQSVEFLLQIGPTAALLRRVEPALRVAVRRSLAEALRPYQQAHGVVLDAAAWIVSARNFARA